MNKKINLKGGGGKYEIGIASLPPFYSGSPLQLIADQIAKVVLCFFNVLIAENYFCDK